MSDSKRQKTDSDFASETGPLPESFNQAPRPPRILPPHYGAKEIINIFKDFLVENKFDKKTSDDYTKKLSDAIRKDSSLANTQPDAEMRQMVHDLKTILIAEGYAVAKSNGGRRRSSTARKSSSRRGRRSSKKRATKRKPKRRQRRASRRAY